jgi:hypothetical protein
MACARPSQKPQPRSASSSQVQSDGVVVFMVAASKASSAPIITSARCLAKARQQADHPRSSSLRGQLGAENATPSVHTPSRSLTQRSIPASTSAAAQRQLEVSRPQVTPVQRAHNGSRLRGRLEGQPRLTARPACCVQPDLHLTDTVVVEFAARAKSPTRDEQAPLCALEWAISCSSKIR